LSPLDPLRWTFWAALALAHLIAGRYEETIEWADRALHENPAANHALGFKAAASSGLGASRKDASASNVSANSDQAGRLPRSKQLCVPQFRQKSSLFILMVCARRG
jgi:hypothetical protein